ncbi:MAG: hypothetical protein OEV43_02875 [Coriobacteriia bacterium]|nr:hypothetical protein [Coriobacteriia bacterium]
MVALDREAVVDLARHFGWPSVSMYLPTHRVRTQTTQDLIRFKNLLKSAGEELLAGGIRAADAAAILEPARALLDDSAFWKHLGDGLATFIGPDTFEAFVIDSPMLERVFVGDRFLIRPLLPALHGNEHFYVLALSKNRVRLLSGTRSGVEEMSLVDAPTSLAEALRYDDYERQVQFHTRTPAAAAGRGQRSAVFHGHGGLPDVNKDNLLRYFRAVDKGIHDLLRDDTAPLLLAGVDYLLPLYREANSYAHLADEAMPGNPDELTPIELHAEAVRVLEPHFRHAFETHLAELDRLAGTDLYSADLGRIVGAAHEGRVKVLFVPEHRTDWGIFDPASGAIELHDERLPGDRDLADLAAAETLLHGGIVHTLAAEEAQSAAILRY